MNKDEKKKWLLKDVPKSERTAKTCLAYVRHRASNLEYVPLKLRTKELCLSVLLDGAGWALQYVPEKLRTLDLCLLSVNFHGWALQYVPEHLRTHEVCLMAVHQYGSALSYVPEIYRTPELCRIAITTPMAHDEFFSTIWSAIPKKSKTKEVCMAAMGDTESTINWSCDESCFWVPCENDLPSFLEDIPPELKEELKQELNRLGASKGMHSCTDDVPEKYRTPEFYLEGIKKDGALLEFVPSEFKTKELCLAAVLAPYRTQPPAIHFLPKEFQTEEMYALSVKDDGATLGFVPEEKRSEKLCRAAVEQNGVSLKFVPEKLRTKELCTIAVKKFEKHYVNEAPIEFIPKEFLTPEIFLDSVQNDGLTLEFIPDDLKTHEICLAAVQQSGVALGFVPDALKTESLCKIALQTSGDYFGESLHYVPKKIRTAELCKIAIKTGGLYAFSSVPKKYKTQEICLAAVSNWAWAIRCVPPKLKTKELWIAAVRCTSLLWWEVPLKWKYDPEILAARGFWKNSYTD
jgi:hypothetical protein